MIPTYFQESVSFTLWIYHVDTWRAVYYICVSSN